MQLHITVNGLQHTIDTDPRERLLDVLREDLGLRGTKYGCGEGECGTCTVILNGRAVNSCLVLAGQAHGAEILTVEGMADDPMGARVLEGFVETGAVQCGFCTPGMVVMARDLLATNPNPSAQEIQYGLAGNLCRCTGYVKIIDAVIAASREPGNRVSQRNLVSQKSEVGWGNGAFVRPASLAEALEIRGREGDSLRVIAGGTDVVVKYEYQRKEMRFLDISGLDELRYIAEDGDSIRLGALTCYQDILTSPLLARWAPEMVAAARDFAGVQVRHLATVGGNLVNASPAADGVPPLYVLGARVRLRSAAGGRELPVTQLATGPGRTVLQPDELLTEIVIPKGHGNGQAMSFFLKVGPRKAQTIAIASVAMRGWLEDGRLRDVRLALGAVAPTVILAPETAALLESGPLSEDLILAAGEQARKECRPIDDLRGTAAYRRALVRGLVVKGLLPLVQRG